MIVLIGESRLRRDIIANNLTRGRHKSRLRTELRFTAWGVCQRWIRL